MGPPARRRVLLTSPTFWPLSDGVANSADFYAQALTRAGYDVTVLTQQRQGLEGREVRAGIDIRRLGVAGSMNILDRYRGQVAALEALIRGLEYDALLAHCWQTWSTDLGMKFSLRHRPGTPIAIVSHGLSTNTLSTWNARLKYPFWRRYQNQVVPEMIRTASRLVVLFDQADEDRFLDVNIARGLGVPYTIIPNVPGYDARLAEAVSSARFGRLCEKRICLCIGAFDHKKNEMFVLDAFARANLPDSALVMVGYKENRYSANLRKLADRLGISDRVLIFSALSREEIAFLYRHAWVYLCGSRTECQPIVVLDAMASKTPFISTPVGCVPSLPGGVIAGDPEEMATALIELASSVERYERLQTAGLQAIESGFSKERVEELIGGLLRELVHAGASPALINRTA